MSPLHRDWMYTAPDQIQEQQPAFTEPHYCGLMALADSWLRKALSIPWKIEYVGFRLWDFTWGIRSSHRGVFYLSGPRCVRLKLTADCEIPASGDPKIE